jgi:hypothetical protein
MLHIERLAACGVLSTSWQLELQTFKLKQVSSTAACCNTALL